jgi:hypothetical protein
MSPNETFLELEPAEQKEQLQQLFDATQHIETKIECIDQLVAVFRQAAKTQPRQAIQWAVELLRRAHYIFSDFHEVRFTRCHEMARFNQACHEVSEFLGEMVEGLQAA